MHPEECPHRRGETHLLSIDAEFSLGTVLAKQGRLGEAQAHYEKAVAESPGSPDRNRIELSLARIADWTWTLEAWVDATATVRPTRR